MLTDHVSRGPHLEIIQFVERRNQVGVVIHGAVEGVHAHHQGLRRALLVDHRYRVLPQGEDAGLREVVADLVEHRVELDVRSLVDARSIGGEHRGATERGRARLTTEKLPKARPGGQAHLPVIHARFVVGRAADRQSAIGAEVAGDDVQVGHDREARV